MKARSNLIAFLSVWLVVSSLASVRALAQGDGLEREIQDVETLLQQARDTHVDIIAPSSYEKAEKKLQEARERFERKGKIEDIRSTLAEAKANLKQAETFTDVGAVILRDAITARQSALDAKAPEHAADEWKKAQKSLYEAGREIEKGNSNGAGSRAAEAVQLLRTAELEAIRNDLLGQARDARDAALKDKADEKAPQTYAEGLAELDKAEAVLKTDRYDRDGASSHAAEAVRAFRHARDIAAVNRRLERGDLDVELEKLLLEHEHDIANLADELGLAADFSAGRGPVLEGIKSALASLRSDRDAIRTELAERDSRIAGLQEDVATLNAQLGRVSDQERQTAASLQTRQERERKLDKIRELFNKAEAEILTRGDELTIRLYGISFPVGTSEIRPQDFDLLTRVQQVLREFPGADVTVEGHTDSSGDDDYNLQLSERRALAVKSYLDANMGLAADRIKAQGMGEAQPIANNETDAGRARNRRIEVRLMLPPIGR